MLSSKSKQVILFIIIAFVFSFATRLLWVYEFKDVEQFKFNNEFMVNTNDSYYYAEGARDILAGGHQENDLSPIKNPLSLLTAFIATITPFSFETIIFYMPAFFSSLIVIPLVLIGHSIKRAEVGFIAAIVGSIAHSYYNRTMVGYYDTDLLNIVFPTILLWSLIWAVRTKEDKYLLFMAFDVIAYRWWYPQSYSLEFAFFGLIVAYVIYQGIRKQDYVYNLVLVTFMMFAMMGLDGIYRVGIVLGLFLLLQYKREMFYKYLKYLFVIAILLFFATGGFDPIWSRLKVYIFGYATVNGSQDLNLHFYAVLQTIQETTQISFATFSERISGHTITFLLSLIGYVWLCVRFPIMLLGLPLVGLGFLALFGGLRFTIYAVPVMALGLGFLISEGVKWMMDGIITRYKILIGFVLIAEFTIAVLVPNLDHIHNYKVPTVFDKDEVVVLDKLKSIASREDYVVGWWDYGYSIRYYADVKTLTDGGKHDGDANFPTSFALTNPQDVAAKMIRLDVEYTEKQFLTPLDDRKKNIPNITLMTLDYGYKDANKFLDSLEGNLSLPTKTKEVYLFLPYKMLGIYSTIKKFSNIDLMTGKMSSPPYFYQTTQVNEEGDYLDFGKGIKLSQKDDMIFFENQKSKLKRFVTTKYTSDEKLSVEKREISKNGSYSVIYMEQHKKYLVVDEETYNSTYFKLFVLEEFDKRFFEPVTLTPRIKVYKLKI